MPNKKIYEFFFQLSKVTPFPFVLMVPIIQRKIDIFKYKVWNIHLIRDQERSLSSVSCSKSNLSFSRRVQLKAA